MNITRVIQGINEDSGQPRTLKIDGVSGALEVIDYEHHELHEGDSYHVSDIQNVSSTTLKWVVTTPDTTKWAHMIFGVDCTGEMTILVTEGGDRTGTNALTAINRNRNSANTAGVTVHRAYSGGTTDGATTVYTKRSGTTGVGVTAGSPGGARGTNEFILKQNTQYIVSVTTYANVYVSLELEWYEHTNED